MAVRLTLAVLTLLALLAGPAQAATPVVNSVNPTSTTAAAGLFVSVTITGSSFENGATALFNGNAVSTTFGSSTQLTAQIPRGNGGGFSISVRNPGGEVAPDSADFSVQTIQPTLTSVSPTTVDAGGAQFVLMAQGSDFGNASLLQWNGSSRTTRVTSATQLEADIPATDIATAGSASVTIFTGGFGGGAGGTSAAQTVTIQAPQPPTITSLVPNTALAGGAAFTLTVNGTNFVNGSSVVRWNGANRTTTFVNATQLTAQIPQADIASAGANSVTVFNAATNLTSAAATFTVNNPPPPVISALTPNGAVPGSGAFTLTVDGSSFVSNSLVRWNGSDRTTTFVSATRLTAAIPASDVVTAGTAQVTVFTPTGSLTSAAATFTISNDTPVLTSVSPATVATGSGTFTLTATGSNFVATSVVRWNGANRTTTFGSSSQLTASIPASDVATAGVAEVTVLNQSTGLVSGARTVTVNNPVPVATSLQPESATVGGGQFTLTVNGSGFVNGSQVLWNGQARTTTFVNSGQLTTVIPASDIASPGTAQVTVSSPTPGGGTSSALTFAINNPTPVLTGINPTAAAAGSAPFTLQVTGTNFLPNSVILFNGVPLTTTFVSSAILSASVPTEMITSIASVNITIQTPAPGGGVSSALRFEVVSLGAAPRLLSAVLPSSRSVGVGVPATAFVTVLNTGDAPADRVRIALRTAIPATLSYQTTDPTTNALTRTPDTPVNIGRPSPPQSFVSQTFVVALTPTAPFDPVVVELDVAGDNATAVTTISGVNTLLLSASAVPVADVVALAATLSGDGIVNVPGVGQAGAFAVATVNVGASAAITASADDGGAGLPLEINLCETNPQTSLCISAIGPSVATTINANATPTFAIFVQARDAIGLDPATRRVFVRFSDAAGVTRGSTSVAVQTQ